MYPVFKFAIWIGSICESGFSGLLVCALYCFGGFVREENVDSSDESLLVGH